MSYDLTAFEMHLSELVQVAKDGRGPTVDAMRSDLLRAGWVEKSIHHWRAPNGALYLGPAGAWRHMVAALRAARTEDT